MTATTSGEINPSLKSGGTVEKATEVLTESIDAPESDVRAVEELIEGLVGAVEELSQEAAKAEARAEELERELQQTRREQAEDRQRIHQLEETVEDLESNPQGTSEKGTDVDDSMTPETPIEQVVALPQEMIDQESANVQRAAFVAEGAVDYTTSVPAGRAITSGELRRVVKAGTDASGHSQTVDRIITVLDDMGGDDIQVVERRGERRIVFTEAICRRLDKLRASTSESHGVVIGTEA